MSGGNAWPLRRMSAYYEQISVMGFSHTRPPFNIQPVKNRTGGLVDIDERIVTRTEFCQLVRFTKLHDDSGQPLPKVLPRKESLPALPPRTRH